MEKPENGCSVAPYEPPHPCHVICTEERSRDGDTITVKTTWSCTSHDPGGRCIVGAWANACKAVDSTKLQIESLKKAASHNAMPLCRNGCDMPAVICDGCALEKPDDCPKCGGGPNCYHVRGEKGVE